MAVLDDLRYELAPLLAADADPDGDLDTYLQAIAAMFFEVEYYALDTVDEDGRELPGWGALLNIDQPDLPSEALAWLAQFVGETIPVGASDTDARAQIKAQPNKTRGTLASIIAEAQGTLIGAKQVIVRERDADASPSEPAYGLTVVTYTSQTPDTDATEAAIRAVKPAGIVLNYECLPGWDVATMEAAGYANLAALEADFADLEHLETNT